MGSSLSVVASLAIIRSTINEIIPPELRKYLWILCRRFSSEVTLVIEESHDESRNHLYNAVVTYLGGHVLFSSSGSSFVYSSQRFTVGKSEKTKNITFGLGRNSEIIDDFRDVRMKWKFSSDENNSTQQKDTSWYELCFGKEHLEMVKNKYLPHILEVAKRIHTQNRIVKFHTIRHDRWGGHGINLEHPMTFDTLAMDGELKKELIEDLDSFINAKQYYKKIGKIWKRGYLLYGPPGTGKSSLVAAMANYLNYDIYNLNLSAVNSDSALEFLLLHVSNRSILVVEDIDCFLHSVTLSGLLNAIDGLLSCCGDERIIVFTTNYKDRIDSALLRAGRMDRHICMSYCTFSIFKQLAANYLNIYDHHLFPRIEKLIAEVEVSPAEVAGELMRIKDTRSSLEDLIQLLDNKIEKPISKVGEEEEVQEEKSPGICNSATMEVGEYRVMAEMGATLIALLSKHGDIAANCSLQSLSCRSFFWEIACRIFQKLEEAELKNLDETDLKTIIADIDDLESVNMEVGWLRKRLNEITERPKVGEFCFKVEGVRRRRSNGAAKMEIETEEGNTD